MGFFRLGRILQGIVTGKSPHGDPIRTVTQMCASITHIASGISDQRVSQGRAFLCIFRCHILPIPPIINDLETWSPGNTGTEQGARGARLTQAEPPSLLSAGQKGSDMRQEKRVYVFRGSSINPVPGSQNAALVIISRGMYPSLGGVGKTATQI